MLILYENAGKLCGKDPWRSYLWNGAKLHHPRVFVVVVVVVFNPKYWKLFFIPNLILFGDQHLFLYRTRQLYVNPPQKNFACYNSYGLFCEWKKGRCSLVRLPAKLNNRSKGFRLQKQLMIAGTEWHQNNVKRLLTSLFQWWQLFV